MSLSTPNTLSRRFLSAMLGMAFLVPQMAQAQAREDVINVNKIFTMAVQTKPFTEPGNPQVRTVTVDCGKLEVTPKGALILTGAFADDFDLPPLRKSSPAENPAVAGTAALTHIGSQMDDNHQICVAQSETYSGKALRQETPHMFQIKDKTYKTSVPFTDDRYCAPMAALKLCTQNPEDDKKISPVYQITPEGNVTLVPENL